MKEIIYVTQDEKTGDEKQRKGKEGYIINVKCLEYRIMPLINMYSKTKFRSNHSTGNDYPQFSKLPILNN